MTRYWVVTRAQFTPTHVTPNHVLDHGVFSWLSTKQGLL